MRLRSMGSVLSAKAVSPAARQHPTEKPVDLMGQIVAAINAETILDPFMGSGSTLVAAKNHGRKSVGCDVDERWCEVAAERLRQGVFNL